MTSTDYTRTALPLPNGLYLFLLLLLVRLSASTTATAGGGRLAFMKGAPAADALVTRGLPVLVVLALALAHLRLLVLLALLAPFLLHLGLHLPPTALLVVDEHLAGLVAPLLGEQVRLELLAVDRQLLLAEEQHARVGNGLVEALAVLLVHELRLRLLEPVKGVGRERVLALVRVDEERLFAVRDFDVGLGDAGLEVEDCVSVVRGAVRLRGDCRWEEGVRTHPAERLSRLCRFPHPGDLLVSDASVVARHGMGAWSGQGGHTFSHSLASVSSASSAALSSLSCSVAIVYDSVRQMIEANGPAESWTLVDSCKRRGGGSAPAGWVLRGGRNS